jgi:hypothetical protein
MGYKVHTCMLAIVTNTHASEVHSLHSREQKAKCEPQRRRALYVVIKVVIPHRDSDAQCSHKAHRDYHVASPRIIVAFSVVVEFMVVREGIRGGGGKRRK